MSRCVQQHRYIDVRAGNISTSVLRTRLYAEDDMEGPRLVETHDAACRLCRHAFEPVTTGSH